jgi:hypothetical protein
VCKHHWQLGVTTYKWPLSHTEGRCKLCGETRTFTENVRDIHFDQDAIIEGETNWDASIPYAVPLKKAVRW